MGQTGGGVGGGGEDCGSEGDDDDDGESDGDDREGRSFGGFYAKTIFSQMEEIDRFAAVRNNNLFQNGLSVG